MPPTCGLVIRHRVPATHTQTVLRNSSRTLLLTRTSLVTSGLGRPGGTSQPFDNGTSAACPVAAGVGALLLSVDSTLTPAELKGALIQSAVDIGTPGYDFETGHGVVNAAAAFRLVEWADRADLI